MCFARFVAALALFVGILVGDRADAGIILKESTRYYRVSGLSGKKLYLDMVKRGAAANHHKEFLASSNIAFSFGKAKAILWGNQCRVTDIAITVSVLYIIPQWSDASRANPAMRSAWAGFLDHLWRHEHHHVELAREAARRLLGELKSIRGDARKKCRIIGEGELMSRTEQLLEDYHRRQKAFDDSSWGDGGKMDSYDLRLIAAK